MRRSIVLGVAVLAATLFAMPARADVSDELAEELNGYVQNALSKGDATAKRAALLTLGFIADDEKREKIAEYKTARKASVRTAAGLALWLAGADGAKTFAVKELLKRRPLFPVLRREVTVLPDERERELLAAVVEKGKRPHKKDVFRYLARQQGTLYEMLDGYVGSSDKQVQKAALRAIRTTIRKPGLEMVERHLIESGDEAQQLRGIEMASYYSRYSARRGAAAKVLERALELDSERAVVQAGSRLLEMRESSAVGPLVELMGSTEKLKRKKRIARMILEHDLSPPTEEVTSLYKEAKMATMEKPPGAPKSKKGNEKGGGKAVDEELTELYLRLSAATGKSNVFAKLKQLFGTTRFEKRLKAARALGYVDRPQSVDMLGKALFEGAEKMRYAAATSLRRLGRKGALPALKRSISQERSQRVKIEVIRALGAIGTPRALRILRFNSTTKNPKVRKAIIAAVREAGSKSGFKTLRLFLSARDLKIQWRAFVAALELAPKRAMKRVGEVFRNPPDGFMADLRTLPTPRLELIYPELLKMDNERVRREAFRTGLKLGTTLHELYRRYAFDGGAPKDTRRRSIRLFSELRLEQDRTRFEQLVRNSRNLQFKTLGAWTLAEYASTDLEATFRGFVTTDSPLIEALGAYGLARMNAAK